MGEQGAAGGERVELRRQGPLAAAPQDADELRSQALLEHDDDVQGARGRRVVDAAQRRGRSERARGGPRLGEQPPQPGEDLALGQRRVEPLEARVAAAQGGAEGVDAVARHLVEDAVGRDLAPGGRDHPGAAGEAERQRGRDRGAPRHGRGRRRRRETAQREDHRRRHRREPGQDPARRVALPDVGEDLGRVDEIVHRHEVEPAAELREEEPLGGRHEEQPVDERPDAAPQHRLLQARAVPALRHDHEIERQGQDQPQRHHQVVALADRHGRDGGGGAVDRQRPVFGQQGETGREGQGQRHRGDEQQHGAAAVEPRP